MDQNDITFSIVTATFNAGDVLPRLIESLQAQTDADFEWIVADGESTDGTLELLDKASKTLNVRVNSMPDFGIYDALNRAVKSANGDYYLVMGADDELLPDGVEKYKNACLHSNADLVTARIEVDGKVKGIRNGRSEWLHGPFAYVSGHSVGVTIRRSLHERFGWYSPMLPIAADQLFLLEAVHRGAKISERQFVAGKYHKDGTSGHDVMGSLTEGARARVRLGHNVWLQVVLLCLRLIKHRHRLSHTHLQQSTSVCDSDFCEPSNE